MIKDRLERIYERMERATARSGRKEAVVVLAAVKGRQIEAIRELVALGVRSIGENRLDEAEAHQEALRDPAVTWEYIGKVQSRKIRDLMERFSRIQSLEDARHARKMNEVARKSGKPCPVLVEVNIGEETTKQGVMPGAFYGLVSETGEACPEVVIEGITVMPPETGDPEASRPYFARAKRLFEGLSERGLPNVRPMCLSMGTSQDFEVAIEEGATMVRLGRVLFD
jgi:pyridoxal phosphate enzyme (YggS family)